MAWNVPSETKKFADSIDDAERYLREGGLGEVVGLTYAALEAGSKKVTSDADMVIALCRIAQDAIDKASK